MTKHLLVLSGLACLASCQVSAEIRQTFTEEYGLANAIADHFVRSFPADKELTEEEKALKKGQKLWKAEMPNLSEREKSSLIFNKIFAKSSSLKELEKDSSLLNEYSWDDLNILYGTRSAPDYHLVSRTATTCTKFGEAALATLLVTPIVDVTELQRRQATLKAFIEVPARTSRIREALKTFKPAEEGMISLWSDNDPLFSGPYEEFVNNLFYFKYLSPLNGSSTALETSKRLVADFSIVSFGALVGFMGYMTYKDKNPIYGVQTGFAAFVTTMIYDQFSSPLYYLAKRLADIKDFVTAAQEVDSLIASNAELETLYGKRLTKLRALIYADSSSEKGQFIANLSAMSLHSWSFFFRHNGRLLRTYKLLLGLRDELVDAIYEVGQLDAYVAVADLVADSKEHTNGYNFATLLPRTEQAKPYIKITNMWNPFLDAAKAVPNSFEMDSQNGVRNAIITGPNAGGKSTFITGIATSLLLAQTFGIVAAEEAVITPFNKISTYINLTDDIAKGKSLFMAEVQRAQDHITTLANLGDDEFCFSIMDELFSGTNPVEGEAAAYSIAHHMGQYENSLGILATHFPRLTLLEERAKEDRFANFKVIVHRDPDTRALLYPFTIQPGKSNQTIAIDILEQEGYDSDMLKEARDIIDHPEKYTASFN